MQLGPPIVQLHVRNRDLVLVQGSLGGHDLVLGAACQVVLWVRVPGSVLVLGICVTVICTGVARCVSLLLDLSSVYVRE